MTTESTVVDVPEKAAPIRIGALDTETLDLNLMTTVMYDAALVIIDVVPGIDIRSQNIRPEIHAFRVDILEQLSLGRTASAETLNWHSRIKSQPTFQRILQEPDDRYQNVSVAEFFDTVRRLMADVDQLWINGLSFDPIVIDTLALTIGEKRPWDFRKEVDVRSMHKRIPYDEQEFVAAISPLAKHDAIDDAMWNLNQALSLQHWLDNLPAAHTTKVRKSKQRSA